ncbi:MAG TPA: thioredoxin family protein [bacterium]
MDGVKVEFLYWEECPSHELALQRLRAALQARRISDPVRMIEVTTERQAVGLDFPGSPTMRIDGRDLFPVPPGPYGLTCRIYQTGDGRVTPLPTQEMIARALDRLNDSARKPHRPPSAADHRKDRA